MSIKIEEGKFYRTQSGKKVGPMIPSYRKDWPWIVVRGDGQCWDDYGLGIAETDSPDLIAEWIDTPTLWRDMIPEEKGAVLLAHHEGKVIEAIDPQDKSDTWGQCFNVGEIDDYAYRIKPEPKRETVTLHGCGFYWEQSEQPCPSDTHRITFDTIDGEPDLTSIEMEKI